MSERSSGDVEHAGARSVNSPAILLAILDPAVPNSIPDGRDPSRPRINGAECQQVRVWMGEDHFLCATHLLAQVIEFRLRELLPHGRHQIAGTAFPVGFEDI